MFERFTKPARTAVVMAQEEARMLDHPWVGPEHLLLGITAQTGVPGAATLARLGVTPDACRAALGAAEPLGQDDAEALRSLGIDLDAVRGQAENAFGPGALDRPPVSPEPHRRLRRGAKGTDGPRGHIPFTQGAKRALERALREALARKDRHIGPEHIVLGVLATEDRTTAGLLRKLGTEPAAVRGELLTDLRAAA